MIGGTGPPETARTKDSSWRWRRNRLIRRHVSNVAAARSPRQSWGERLRIFAGRTPGVILAFAYIRRKSTPKNLRGLHLNAVSALSDTKMAARIYLNGVSRLWNTTTSFGRDPRRNVRSRWKGTKMAWLILKVIDKCLADSIEWNALRGPRRCAFSIASENVTGAQSGLLRAGSATKMWN